MRSVLFVVVCFCVGLAVKIKGGNYDPISIAWVVGAMTAALIAVADPAGMASRRLPKAALIWTLACGAIPQFVLMLGWRKFPYQEESAKNADTLMTTGLLGVAIGAAVCAVAGLRKRDSRAWVVGGIGIVLLCHLVAGLSAVRTDSPPMDVIVFQDLAARELLEGQSPYAMTFPDFSFGHSTHYGPGLQKDYKLLFGFPYPPLSLIAVLPAPLLGGDFGDFRFVHALCMTLVGAAIALARPSAVGGLAAAMVLLTPIGPLVLVSGWTEPLVALMLAATVFVAVRKPNLTGIPLGLFWAVKQYVPLTAPLMWLLPIDGAARSTGVARWKPLLIALLVGAVVTLPLALMDFPAFWRSAIALQLQQPFRDDALSLQTLFYRMTGSIPPSWPAFVALAGVQALAIWRMPRTAAGFAGATATTLLIFFAFSKQAFANYYFLVIAAAALAVAADRSEIVELREPDLDRGG